MTTIKHIFENLCFIIVTFNQGNNLIYELSNNIIDISNNISFYAIFFVCLNFEYWNPLIAQRLQKLKMWIFKLFYLNKYKNYLKKQIIWCSFFIFLEIKIWIVYFLIFNFKINILLLVANQIKQLYINYTLFYLYK